ncbi:MAG: hypothetical protein ABL883_06315 [Terricaulis sp.]
MTLLKKIVSRTRDAGAARALEIAAYAGAAAWLGASFVGVPSWMSGVAEIGANRTFVVMIAVLVAALGLTVLSELGELYGQRARDLYANSVFAALQRGEKPAPYSLYLRPFASTNVIGANVGIGMQAERIELEAQIERATRPIGPLIALGAPLEHIGAGRIQVGDDAWRAAIALLLKHATLIVMLPSSRAGTLQEIGIILGSALVTRTVLIDPPNLGTSKTYNHAIEWAKIQAAFKEASFHLPDEQRGGSLIFYGDSREPLLREHLQIDAEDRIERIFTRILKFQKTRRVTS